MKKRWLSFLLALVVAFCAGIASDRAYARWELREDLCRNVGNLQMFLGACQSLQERTQWETLYDPFDMKMLNRVSADMIGNTLEYFGTPPYESEAEMYLLSVAQFVCITEFSNWDRARWEQFWEDAAPILAVEAVQNIDLERDILDIIEAELPNTGVPLVFSEYIQDYIPRDDFY